MGTMVTLLFDDNNLIGSFVFKHACDVCSAFYFTFIQLNLCKLTHLQQEIALHSNHILFFYFFRIKCFFANWCYCFKSFCFLARFQGIVFTRNSPDDVTFLTTRLANLLRWRDQADWRNFLMWYSNSRTSFNGWQFAIGTFWFELPRLNAPKTTRWPWFSSST